ncbi:MAG: hypothetical protein EB047_00515 [Chitinophagaceae bacterium]|nr:hypothetical protein [Chitinophagaceae bacterium]
MPMTPTILYIIYNQEYNAIKIGIGDITGKRFRQHRTKGWELVCYWYFQNRAGARRVESIVLQTLRERYGHYLDKGDMPQRGYTETFDASKITKRKILRLVNKAIKGLL